MSILAMFTRPPGVRIAPPGGCPAGLGGLGVVVVVSLSRWRFPRRWRCGRVSRLLTATMCSALPTRPDGRHISTEGATARSRILYESARTATPRYDQPVSETDITPENGQWCDQWPDLRNARRLSWWYGDSPRGMTPKRQSKSIFGAVSRARDEPSR